MPVVMFEGLELCTSLEFIRGLIHEKHANIEYEKAHDSEKKTPRHEECECTQPVELNQV